MISAETLRSSICLKKGINQSSSLQRAYSILTSIEVKDMLIDEYTCLSPGTSLIRLPQYIWRRLFTFNVDNVAEELYKKSPTSKQHPVSLNFTSTYEPIPDAGELQIVHLHGSIADPKPGFVFSNAEYARQIQAINPWMNMLAQLLASESFIIAGTSLSEIDLEYYLSHRSTATPRKGRGPSFLVEPNPDAVTEVECEKYGLTLIKARIGEFLEWINQLIPNPPSLYNLRVPKVDSVFQPQIKPIQLVKFFADFSLITPEEKEKRKTPSPFLYGKEPTNDDLDQHLDILRPELNHFIEKAQASISGKSPIRLHIVLDPAGTGKTTFIKRAAREIAREGFPVLALHALTKIDTKNAIDCLKHAKKTTILIADSAAEHAEQLRQLLESEAAQNIIIVCAERSYRNDLLELIFDGVQRETTHFESLRGDELRQLIELYRSYGLIGDPDIISDPALAVSKLKHDPIAIACCRILNDFKPLEAIIKSLWLETNGPRQRIYLCSALARHCHNSGIKYSILQSIAGIKEPIGPLLDAHAPLAITEHQDNEDYLVPLNTSLADEIIKRIAAQDGGLMMDAFRSISSRLVPYVNRLTIKLRTPEAKLAGRLFDADKVVKPLLGDQATKLYELCQKDWEWNSRYWEQRALLTSEFDVELAIRYARNAVSLEIHPHTLTTLGKILLRNMDSSGRPRADVYSEAHDILTRAIKIEGFRSRITIHPFSTLLSGTLKFITSGGKPTPSQVNNVRDLCIGATRLFKEDKIIFNLVNELRKVI